MVELLIGESGVDVDISILFDEYLLDLTMYEAGNALWKTGLAHDNLTDSELETAVMRRILQPQSVMISPW
ncbi:PilT protein domain-containing protein [Natrialba hulunbeirensis JCM 10989]|uniref:PilT protein domain-containing protein n=1 Tax=Natrialba hulunbeirensis JCM 10989 TaxID=1227493 RepID=M0A4U1_9EURY|nr:hypothetical protein [Natrialba hulunbeirensis]ELY93356.1 PilT protein domain-containing protein [Natrialba hulunbeirensis JCM 10989]